MNFTQIGDIVVEGAYGGSHEFAKTVGRKTSMNQKEAVGAGDASDSEHALLNLRADVLWPQFPYQPYPSQQRQTVMAEVHMPPLDRLSPQEDISDIGAAISCISAVIAGETERQPIELIESDVTDPPAPSKVTFEDQVASLNREIIELREQLVQLQNADTAPETPDEVNVRMIRTKMIVSEVSFDKKLKKKLLLEDIEEIQFKVEAKIQSDRNSADHDIYQRNQALLHHLIRRQKYSKSGYKILKQLWILLGVSGDLMSFTGQLFDREYLNPKSDKYYKYVSILTFMLKYQRLSKMHPKLWFKDVKEQDKDDYFFNNWQRKGIITDV